MPRCDPYIIKIKYGRNCYNCGGFGYITKYCRKRYQERVEQERRIDYEDNLNNYNLNGEENLIVLNYILTTIDLQYSLE